MAISICSSQTWEENIIEHNVCADIVPSQPFDDTHPFPKTISFISADATTQITFSHSPHSPRKAQRRSLGKECHEESTNSSTCLSTDDECKQATKSPVDEKNTKEKLCKAHGDFTHGPNDKNQSAQSFTSWPYSFDGICGTVTDVFTGTHRYHTVVKEISQNFPNLVKNEGMAAYTRDIWNLLSVNEPQGPRDMEVEVNQPDSDDESEVTLPNFPLYNVREEIKQLHNKRMML